MPTVKELLKDLELGNSVAEFDDQLESYFVETQPFRELVRDRKDIVAGDKGTGKTAIFKVLHKRYHLIPELKNVIVLPAFNTIGNPIFQQLTESGPLNENEYIHLWKAFFISLAGNWVLKHNRIRPKTNLAKLEQLLIGLELRSENDTPHHVFSKIIGKIGRLFHWKSAEFKIETSPEGGMSFVPKVEFGENKEENESHISIESALQLLNTCLSEVGKSVWIAVDRLDEAFQGHNDIEIPALRALFRSYLDLLAFERIKLKLFVRRDLFSRIVSGGFVNLTHVNAKKVEVIWDEEDLLSLLCKRVKKNAAFTKAVANGNFADKQIFYRIFPNQVDPGSRKPETWVWMLGRIKDGNGIRPPRNLIDLVSMAKDAQLRREDRDPREFDKTKAMIETDALRRGLALLSEQRVNDTLLAEAGSQAPLIEKFRRGKAEHNDQSLSELLGIFPGAIRDYIKPLIELGFLEEVGGTYKIPMLYRGGLEITQGKAFEDKSSDAEDEENTLSEA